MKKIILIIFLLFPFVVRGIDTSATSAILMDTDNNRIIYAKNINNVRSVASISKIMTAILAIESQKLNKKVTVDETIKKAYGSAIYIKEGEVLTLKDLVYGLMLRSGNDAAYMIAKYVSGDVDEFVKKMNNKAKEIGMKNTTFNNPCGLDEEKGNYSTAYDMAILTSYAMKNKEYRKIVKTKEYKLSTNKNTYLWKNKNKLLRQYKYTTGGKTGFTKKAKRTLVTTASKNNVNLVVVTLNDGNDFKDHKDLFEYGFANYKNYNILKKGNIDLYDDKYYKNYSFYIKKDINYLLSDEEKNNVTLKYEITKKKKIENDKNVGKVIVMINNKKVKEEKIFIKRNKRKWSLW